MSYSLRFLLSWMQWGVHGTTASRFRSGREAGKNENRFVVTGETWTWLVSLRESIATRIGAASEKQPRNPFAGKGFWRRCRFQTITEPVLALLNTLINLPGSFYHADKTAILPRIPHTFDLLDSFPR